MQEGPPEDSNIELRPGAPLDSDEVYYDEESGVLVAKMGPGPARATQLIPLMSNVTLELDAEGQPVYVDTLRRKELWGRRHKIELGLPIEDGRLRFRNFRNYWTLSLESATVSADESGSSVIVEMLEGPSGRAVRISPRVVFVLEGLAGVRSILITNPETRVRTGKPVA